MNRATFIKSTLSLICGSTIVGCSYKSLTPVVIQENSTISFFGDSITFQGGYIKVLQKHFLKTSPHKNITLLNRGKNSETVSGLSEAIHDPRRPILFDRLNDNLSEDMPDIAFFCYGINDAIYHPYNADNFTAYKKGVVRFLDECHRRSINVVLLTPPPMRPSAKLSFNDDKDNDKLSWKTPYWNYGPEVMDRYRGFILKIAHPAIQGKIDIYTSLSENITKSYNQDPIHPNEYGHNIIARTIVKSLSL